MSRDQDTEKISATIRKDYADYIHHLSPEEQQFATIITLFQHPDGRFAVQISIGLNGTRREHLLIYNANNVRIKVIRYTSGWYMSQFDKVPAVQTQG